MRDALSTIHLHATLETTVETAVMSVTIWHGEISTRLYRFVIGVKPDVPGILYR
ncbi:hypothetical protein BIW11_03340 [Tropilaelaps mercedesae]|uniref:Uncharacterized protein n=1 Tax=Tropilaelaps mercedesae TaxID=418985 RepID=A0A1V9XNG0_9ACAR|nr:hypothetical protein BIW11_03340 [Tropilaelaps mercedesae]